MGKRVNLKSSNQSVKLPFPTCWVGILPWILHLHLLFQRGLAMGIVVGIDMAWNNLRAMFFMTRAVKIWSGLDFHYFRYIITNRFCPKDVTTDTWTNEM